MDDGGIRRRSAFGFEDPIDRCGIRGVGAKSVDGFRRERYEPAAAKDIGRALQHSLVETLRIENCDGGLHEEVVLAKRNETKKAHGRPSVGLLV